jgi:putative membrane protein
MKFIAEAVVALVALLHFWFLVLEMFLWQKPLGLKTFGMGKKLAKDTAILAKNQGLYNGFLAAGLTWSLIAPDPALAYPLKLFFLGCAIVAGIYGAFTASPRIFLAQAFPALVALGLVLAAG